jgi:hypothetical protein
LFIPLQVDLRSLFPRLDRLGASAE